MDRSAVLTLISETTERDDYGVWRSTQSTRKVFCQVNSVTRSEFFEGGRNGLNPEYEFTMFAGDYQDERICEYNGRTYGIYRVYHGRNDTVELYAERKGGLNVEPEEEPSPDPEEGGDDGESNFS